MNTLTSNDCFTNAKQIELTVCKTIIARRCMDGKMKLKDLLLRAYKNNLEILNLRLEKAKNENNGKRLLVN